VIAPVLFLWAVYATAVTQRIKSIVIFCNAWASATAMPLIVLPGNTPFISMYVRPKLAAERSRVLNLHAPRLARGTSP
jgi:hypothetical protein